MDRFTWASADAYERYVGRWSREVAAEFLGWLRVPPGRDWLDVGRGTGALTSTILALAAPARLRGCDLSPQYVASARERVNDPGVAFQHADAMALPDPPQAPERPFPPRVTLTRIPPRLPSAEQPGR